MTASTLCRCSRPIGSGEGRCLKCGRETTPLAQAETSPPSPYALALFRGRSTGRPALRWSRLLVIDAFLVYEQEHGVWPTWKDARRKGSDLPAAAVVDRLFGSWDDAVCAAALTGKARRFRAVP